ncbi:hemerythrin domain-containing protein [Rugamonas sp.]|uniref:hemerythrin domain-containing protein n=1 Tax=Rugamonas sp. TaxID=1926287 RepID=UPI0025D891B7|nr:hemerythrin domain-containing protein [Rugamonas sp.]
MTTPSKTTTAGTARSARTSDRIDAIDLLTQDHKNVKAMFEQYEALSDRSRVSKKRVATQICLELTKHAMAEEEIFYPAVRAATGDNDLVDEATVEHASAKELIDQILAMNPDEDLYDAQITVLSEQIEHHVQEEESDMFPKARKAKLDLDALGAAIEARKAEIQFSALQKSSPAPMSQASVSG